MHVHTYSGHTFYRLSTQLREDNVYIHVPVCWQGVPVQGPTPSHDMFNLNHTVENPSPSPPTCSKLFTVKQVFGIQLKCLLVTACKWSLGQGNIFRSVCQEFCSQWGSTWAGTPLDQVHPPGTRYTPWDQNPPGLGTPPRTRYTPLGPEPPPGPGTPPRTR